jgi:hypothetical protein
MYTDGSRLITVTVFAREFAASPSQKHVDAEVKVAPEMVAIGGGGETIFRGAGALLTASYPNPDHSGWLVSSKAHMESDRDNRLIVYAIGIRIDGMTRDALLNSLVFNTTEDDEPVAKPETVASIEPEEFVLVGGGFKVNWRGVGNLATASFPSTRFSWKARSQEHFGRDPSTITTWAIGIKRNLPVGRIEGEIDSRLSSDTAARPSNTANLSEGFALVGGGAEVHQSDKNRGSLLWKLAPATRWCEQSFAAASKDHRGYDDPTVLTAYALGIRMLNRGASGQLT